MANRSVNGNGQAREAGVVKLSNPLSKPEIWTFQNLKTGELKSIRHQTHYGAQQLAAISLKVSAEDVICILNPCLS